MLMSGNVDMRREMHKDNRKMPRLRKNCGFVVIIIDYVCRDIIGTCMLSCYCMSFVIQEM